MNISNDVVMFFQDVTIKPLSCFFDRFVWTVAVETGKASVPPYYSQINFYNYNFRNKTTNLNNSNSSKRLMDNKIIIIIDDNFPLLYIVCCNILRSSEFLNIIHLLISGFN